MTIHLVLFSIFVTVVLLIIAYYHYISILEIENDINNINKILYKLTKMIIKNNTMTEEMNKICNKCRQEKEGGIDNDFF